MVVSLGEQLLSYVVLDEGEDIVVRGEVHPCHSMKFNFITILRDLFKEL